MSMEAKDGKDIEKGLRELESDVIARVSKAVNASTVLTQSHFKQNVFIEGHRGASPMWGHLQNRTHNLSNSIRTVPAEYHYGSIIGRMTIGTPYAGVHFGPRGQSMHIVPKTKQYLAIPLPDAQGNYGQAIGSTHETRTETGGYASSKWSTFVMRSKAGNLLIMGKSRYVKGEKAGKTKGDLVPLFILKKFVDVPTHVDPAEEMRKLQPDYDKRVQEAFSDVKQ